jgi:hypothetical protein
MSTDSAEPARSGQPEPSPERTVAGAVETPEQRTARFERDAMPLLDQL